MLERLRELDVKNLEILLAIAKSEGTGGSNLAETVQMSRSALLSRTEKLRLKGWLTRETRPHPNPGMPPTYIYYLASGISLNMIQTVLDDKLLQAQRIAHVAESQPGSVVVSWIESHDKPDIASTLAQIKTSSRRPHIELLQFIAKSGKATLAQSANAAQASRQTTHSRLEKLRELGLLQRAKPKDSGATEFFYFLPPSISADEIDKLMSELEPPKSGSHEPMSSTSSKPLPNSKLPSASLSQELIRKLPEFDPNWPDNLKERWFASYERLLNIGEQSDQQRNP